MKIENNTVPVSGGGQIKEVWIEYLRAAATLAVVFLHVNMGLVANYSQEELGPFNYIIFNDFYITVKWAVPCFIMISGALLLNPNRPVTWKKIKKYIVRMILVLCSFGYIFSLMELIFSSGTVSLKMVLHAALNVIQGDSWSHMWYIYMLIGLYLITVPLRYMLEKIPVNELEISIFVLIIGLFLIPSINTMFGVSLENYMLISEYVLYYILGYYLSITKRELEKFAVLGAGVSVAFMIGMETRNILHAGNVFSLNHQTSSIFTLILGASVFLLMKSAFKNKETVNKLVNRVCSNSFAIYLIHPIWGNLFYKVLKITPLSFPIVLGILIMFTLMFALSLVTGMVMRKLPFLKDIL